MPVPKMRLFVRMRKRHGGLGLTYSFIRASSGWCDNAINFFLGPLHVAMTWR
jgi:hypothetical protein